MGRQRPLELLVDVTVNTREPTIAGLTPMSVWLCLSRMGGMRVDAAGRIELRARCGHSSTSRISHTGRSSTDTICRCSRANALRTLADGNHRDARWLTAAAIPNRELLRDDTAPAHSAHRSPPGWIPLNRRETYCLTVYKIPP